MMLGETWPNFISETMILSTTTSHEAAVVVVQVRKGPGEIEVLAALPGGRSCNHNRPALFCALKPKRHALFVVFHASSNIKNLIWEFIIFLANHIPQLFIAD